MLLYCAFTNSSAMSLTYNGHAFVFFIRLLFPLSAVATECAAISRRKCPSCERSSYEMRANSRHLRWKNQVLVRLLHSPPHSYEHRQSKSAVNLWTWQKFSNETWNSIARIPRSMYLFLSHFHGKSREREIEHPVWNSRNKHALDSSVIKIDMGFSC
jgi:hypothetical protein